MLQIFNDPALHMSPSDVGSDSTKEAAQSSPTSPIIGSPEDYPVFDFNMVAERASVYSSAISDDADNDATILLPNARSMIDEVMSKIKQIPSDQLQKHWQMASYAHANHTRTIEMVNYE